MVDLREVYRRAGGEFARGVDGISDSQWTDPTPCTEWDVRALLNHIVYECLWVPDLMGGKTVDDVGDRYDGDVLGDDPKGAFRSALEGALASAAPADALDRTVHLSFGDAPGSEYIGQLATDLTIHAWDLAKGIGGPDELDHDLVDFVATMWTPREEMMRAAGVFGDRVEMPPDADQQTVVLALFGRRRDWTAPRTP